MFRQIKLFAICIALSLGIFGNHAQAQNTSVTILRAGDILTPNKPYYSPGNKYFLVFQATDGNLVIYRVGQTTNTAIWSAGSFGGTFAVFQPDGNLVVYRAHGGNPADALFSTGAGRAGDTLFANVNMYDNGKMEVRNTSYDLFKTPADPEFVSTPDPSCPTGRQYPICIFPGTLNQWNTWVLACSAADGQRQAAAMGAAWGRCPGT